MIEIEGEEAEFERGDHELKGENAGAGWFGALLFYRWGRSPRGKHPRDQRRDL
jgi:hypothetical protein